MAVRVPNDMTPEQRGRLRDALAVRDCMAEAAQGFQGVVDVANKPGQDVRESVPHWRKVEDAAARAQYALESSLPVSQRKRHAADVWAVWAMIVGAFLLSWFWQW